MKEMSPISWTRTRLGPLIGCFVSRHPDSKDDGRQAIPVSGCARRRPRRRDDRALSSVRLAEQTLPGARAIAGACAISEAWTKPEAGIRQAAAIIKRTGRASWTGSR